MSNIFRVNFEQDLSLEKNANVSQEETHYQRMTMIYIYSAMILATIVLALGHSIFFFIFCLMSSSYIHDFVFSKIVKGTMRFFNANPSGRILNRFSKDLGIMDEYIPTVMFDVLDVSEFSST